MGEFIHWPSIDLIFDLLLFQPFWQIVAVALHRNSSLQFLTITTLFLNRTGLLQEEVHAAGDWGDAERCAEKTRILQDPHQQEKPRPRQQDPEGQAAPAAGQDGQQCGEAAEGETAKADTCSQWWLLASDACAGKVHGLSRQKEPPQQPDAHPARVLQPWLHHRCHRSSGTPGPGTAQSTDPTDG